MAPRRALTGLFPGKELPLPIRLETVWVPEPASMLYGRKSPFPVLGIELRILGRPSRSFVATSTGL
jgi:hypothetical protein